MGHHLKSGQGGTDDLAQLVGVSLEYTKSWVLSPALHNPAVCVARACNPRREAEAGGAGGGLMPGRDKQQLLRPSPVI